MTDNKGVLINLEGPSGSGKSTQARLLAERLRNEGHDVVLTREPGGSPGAEEIRALVLQGDPDRWSLNTQLFLMLAAHNDHLEHTVNPALAAGKIVICERYADRARILQVFGKTTTQMSGFIEMLRTGFGFRGSDLVLALDVPKEIIECRVSESGVSDQLGSTSVMDKYDQSDYNVLACFNPDHTKVVRGEGSEAEVADQIWQLVSEQLELV